MPFALRTCNSHLTNQSRSTTSWFISSISFLENKNAPIIQFDSLNYVYRVAELCFVNRDGGKAITSGHLEKYRAGAIVMRRSAVMARSLSVMPVYQQYFSVAVMKGRDKSKKRWKRNDQASTSNEFLTCDVCHRIFSKSDHLASLQRPPSRRPRESFVTSRDLLNV